MDFSGQCLLFAIQLPIFGNCMAFFMQLAERKRLVRVKLFYGKEVVRMEQTYMKEKPILGLVLSMSLPMILSMMVNALYNIVDSLFVAKISEQAMTALSLVYPVQNMVNAVSIGFGVGINAVIAIYLGAQDYKKVNAAATHGFILSIIQGILLTAISIGIMPSFLSVFTEDAGILPSGLQYSNIVFCFATVIALNLFYEKIFQAVGKMTVSMVGMMVGCVANIILDPIFIFGLGPVPRMEIEGAALATGIGQVLSLIVYLICYFKDPIPVKVSKKEFSWSWRLTGRLYSIGIPATLNLALPSAGGIQLWGRGTSEGAENLYHYPDAYGCHYGGGNRPVPGGS